MDSITIACRALLLMAFIAAIAPSAGAQSLADVARQEEARRGAAKKAARSYSDADLKSDSVTIAPVAAEAAAEVAAPRGFFSLSTGTYVSAEEIIARSQAAIAKGQAAKGNDKRAEEYWRVRSQRIRGELTTARRQVETLSAARPASAPERALTEKALKSAQAVVDDLEHQWAKLKTQGGAAGIPPAWVQ